MNLTSNPPTQIDWLIGSLFGVLRHAESQGTTLCITCIVDMHNNCSWQHRFMAKI